MSSEDPPQTPSWVLPATLVGVLLFVALRAASVHTENVNWDEFNLIHNAAWTWQSGELHAGGRPGLAVLLLLPFVADCANEIEVARSARSLWILFGVGMLVGLWCVLARFTSRRDAWFGVALLALVPEFLVWSLQVRTDQPALAAALLAGAALLASRERPVLATVAGALIGLGFLSSQKALYVVGLVGVLVIAEHWRDRDLRFSREGLRGMLALAAAGMVVVGYYALIPQLFSGEGAPTLSAPLPALGIETAGRQVAFQMNVFDYYRSTIGYSQYVEMLPHLAVHLLLLAAMVFVTLRGWLRRESFTSAWWAAWGAIALGVFVGSFHAGAFKYFWMTLGLFPAVALALARPELSARLSPALRRPAAVVVLLALFVPAAVQSVQLLEDTQAVQRETIDFARRNFAPDDAGFHAEAGLFCSDDANRFPAYFSQLIERRFGARAGCRDCAPNLIRKFSDEQVKYVVATFRLNQFPPLIRDFWQENYLPYRGSLLVAGKLLKAEAPRETVDIVVDGEYLWLPNRPPADVSINGQRVRTGERVRLSRGPNEVDYSETESPGMLVLAMDAPPRLPLSPFYRDF